MLLEVAKVVGIAMTIGILLIGAIRIIDGDEHRLGTIKLGYLQE
jgi:hypothetical protein